MPKYITLIFSHTPNFTSNNFKSVICGRYRYGGVNGLVRLGEHKVTGHGGLCHNVSGYLLPLINKAKQLNLIAVLPPPWISLSSDHNDHKKLSKDLYWDEYFDLTTISNVAQKMIFQYDDNGNIITDLSIAYYDSKINLNNIKTDADIIALVNYDNPKIKGRLIDSMLGGSKPIKFDISNKYKKNVDKIISGLNISEFATIHIRRGDALVDPINIRLTDPKFVANFIKKKININIPIFILTNEKDVVYKETLIKLLTNYKLIFETDLYKFLSDDIIDNNYSMYTIICEIANRAKINVGTRGYVRLGKKYDFRLENFN